jgi:hypothetical protein
MSLIQEEHACMGANRFSIGLSYLVDQSMGRQGGFGVVANVPAWSKQDSGGRRTTFYPGFVPSEVFKRRILTDVDR